MTPINRSAGWNVIESMSRLVRISLSLSVHQISCKWGNQESPDQIHVLRKTHQKVKFPHSKSRLRVVKKSKFGRSYTVSKTGGRYTVK